MTKDIDNILDDLVATYKTTMIDPMTIEDFNNALDNLFPHIKDHKLDIIDEFYRVQITVLNKTYSSKFANLKNFSIVVLVFNNLIATLLELDNENLVSVLNLFYDYLKKDFENFLVLFEEDSINWYDFLVILLIDKILEKI